MDEMTAAISAIIEARCEKDDRIRPSWIAQEAMQKFDPKRLTHIAIYATASEGAKQIARRILRKIDPVADDNQQQELFTGHLQSFYAADRPNGDDPEFVRRDYSVMTESDSRYNIDRMRAQSESLAQHADALETWENKRPKTSAAA
jgi:hypothetical protein